jgi:methyl-accepting chemotaxis protein
MDQVTKQNAAMVEESTAASHSLAQETEQLFSIIDQFRIGSAKETPNIASREIGKRLRAAT